MTNDEITISGRDFGRLEGKVDAIASDVLDLKVATSGLTNRVGKIEEGYALIKGGQIGAQQISQHQYEKNDGTQMTRQTLILLGSLILGTAGLALGVWLSIVMHP